MHYCSRPLVSLSKTKPCQFSSSLLRRSVRALKVIIRFDEVCTALPQAHNLPFPSVCFTWRLTYNLEWLLGSAKQNSTHRARVCVHCMRVLIMRYVFIFPGSCRPIYWWISPTWLEVCWDIVKAVFNLVYILPATFYEFICACLFGDDVNF